MSARLAATGWRLPVAESTLAAVLECAQGTAQAQQHRSRSLDALLGRTSSSVNTAGRTHLLLASAVWCRASIAAALGLSAGAFLVKHSRLAGSTDLDDWVRAAAATAKGKHVSMPQSVGCTFISLSVTVGGGAGMGT